MVDTEIAVHCRADGVWVVILARAGAAPMEFTCDGERQARAFAETLKSAKQSYGAIAAERSRGPRTPPVKAGRSWGRFRTA